MNRRADLQRHLVVYRCECNTPYLHAFMWLKEIENELSVKGGENQVPLLTMPLDGFMYDTKCFNVVYF